MKKAPEKPGFLDRLFARFFARREEDRNVMKPRGTPARKNRATKRVKAQRKTGNHDARHRFPLHQKMRRSAAVGVPKRRK